MQALPILPLLMSVFAMAISLLAGVWPGAIIIVDFIKLSEVHFIIAAEAGDTAKAETIAAAIKNLIQTSLGDESQRQAGQQGTHSLRRTFPQEDNFLAAMQRDGFFAA